MAVEALFDTASGEAERWTLVHGTVANPEDGTRHGHAWLERQDEPPPRWREHFSAEFLRVCVDKSNGHDVSLPAPVYYGFGRVKDTKRYSQEQARAQVLKSGHYGPWQEWGSVSDETNNDS